MLDFMNWFGKGETVVRPSVNVSEALQSIPALNPDVSLEEDKDGRTVVCVPVQRRKGFWGRFQMPVSTHRIRLDEIGAFVVSQINGERTVQELIDAFATKYRVNGREAKLCMADFLKSLAGRNVISIGIK
jgi:hypothetical protein